MAPYGTICLSGPGGGFGRWAATHVLDVGSDREIETAFTTLVQRGADALLLGIGALLSSRRERIIALAARHGIPAISPYREFAGAGGLMSYGPRITDAYRQAGVYAGRILKGEKPGDLPVMLPTNSIS